MPLDRTSSLSPGPRWALTSLSKSLGARVVLLLAIWTCERLISGIRLQKIPFRVGPWFVNRRVCGLGIFARIVPICLTRVLHVSYFAQLDVPMRFGLWLRGVVRGGGPRVYESGLTIDNRWYRPFKTDFDITGLIR